MSRPRRPPRANPPQLGVEKDARNSDGLKPQPARSVDIGRAPARVRTAYDAVIGHYEHMHRYRLRTSASGSASD